MNNSTHILFGTSLAALAAAVVPMSAKDKDAGNAADSQRPNILLICPEDNSTFYGCYGEDVQTPVVDALAQKGVLFSNAFCPQGGSSPGRACFLTGLYPHQNGQVGLASWSFGMYHEDTPNIVNTLKDAGYRTGIIGKLHINPESAFHFDYWPFKDANFLREGMNRYADCSKEFIEKCGDTPFYLQVNYPDTHLPFIKQVDGLPEHPLDEDEVEAFPYLGLTSPKLKKRTANYLNCLMRLDHYVGELLKVLEESGKADNTMIIYVADHGIDLMRAKHSAYDMAFHIPMIICWPGHTAENFVYDGIVSQLDIYPTVLDAVGLDIPDYLPGKPLTKVLKGKDVDLRDYFIAEYNSHANNCPYPQRSVRTKRFHMIWNPLHGTVNPNFNIWINKFTDSLDMAKTIAEAPEQVQQAYKTTYCPPEYELYDLENDPYEFVNLAYEPEFRRVRNKLARKLVRWQKETKDAFIDTAVARRFFNDVLNQGEDRSIFPYKDYMDPHIDFGIQTQDVKPVDQELDLDTLHFAGDARMVYYDDNRYEAFTDIIEFKGKYYISFRDGFSHVWEEDGTAQGHTYVIMSEDEENWVKVADMAEPGIDLRDPKLSITPDNRLMVIMGGSVYGNNKVDSRCYGRLPRVSFSEDGVHFTTPEPIKLDHPSGNDWLWRATWNKKACYGFVKGDQFSLVRSKDGINWKTVKDLSKLSVPIDGDETTVRFLKDGTMLMLARTRDQNGRYRVGNGLWGVSKPPYKDWDIKQIPMGFGGPNFIVVDERYCIVATRWMDRDQHKTVLIKSDLEGNFTPVCILPSGGHVGNCSYPGLLIHGDELWVSYYSQHETPKSAIYLAKLPMSMFE